ncbi:Imidazole glycerol phosphate synthase subunit HisH [Enhygromyxa salina]|uniref:Imidazole glycerol phosphate synthase subunit HisH n=1 Tax=Enhygromyxa salina TaxID=215803 RepID=A0A2S9YEK6_9BACT|nr:imidazole glycerol phosphate synthase subunit HisH [Enhygromyxa salina]PRQ03547.1 Imidazole glycerol phosphate synthase subunit HisH [Enhygromyxa salina]
MARELTLVDSGLGNLASVERALIQVGSATQITDDPDKVATSRIVVFPGQGTFGKQTDNIVSGAMGEAMRMVIQRGDPFLGICLGMQMLFEGSEEAGGHKGLGILKGQCRRFPESMTTAEGDRVRKLKIPHMGWNEVQPSGEHYYFVHSYYVDAAESSDVMWSTTYGDITFASAIRRDNIYGCQFHPEKSQQSGLRFLRAFLLGSRQ